MASMNDLFLKNIQAGLKRHTVKTCSQWAEQYRVMGPPLEGKWTFKYHPWLREMHDCKAELMIGQKGAQLGYTETALNKTFYEIDIFQHSVLYILPNQQPDASNFSSARFDPAVEASPHLTNLFSNVKNVGHKRAGNANLYIRGSNSKSQLKSIPTPRIIADEVDEMEEENITLAFERMSGQLSKQAFLLSTPTLHNVGINRWFNQSTQEHFFFRCPHCSKLTQLIFPECLVIIGDDPLSEELRSSYLICKECKTKLNHDQKPEYLASGIWVPQYTNRTPRGFHVSQLYSFTMRPYEIAKLWLTSITNPTDETEFYNSKLGLPHEVKGARVTDENIQECLSDHRNIHPDTQAYQNKNKLVTMGVDVGKFLHVTVNEWEVDISKPIREINLSAKPKLICAIKLEHFEQLDTLMKFFRVTYSVVDMQPDTRKAREFAQRWHGKVRLCHYDDSLAGAQLREKPEEYQINALRVSWLDLTLGRFKAQRIILPYDISTEYKENIKALVRTYEKDKNGNPVGRYTNGSEADHYAHSQNYAEIALTLACSFVRGENINDLY